MQSERRRGQMDKEESTQQVRQTTDRQEMQAEREEINAKDTSPGRRAQGRRKKREEDAGWMKQCVRFASFLPSSDSVIGLKESS